MTDYPGANTALKNMTLEANPRVRYGFYLRPDFAMSRAQCEMHDILRRQFGLEVGGKFMPHATIMSFFRSDASLSRIEAAIDCALAGQKPFTVTNNGPRPHGRSGVSLDIHHNDDGSPNAALRAVHEAAYAAIVTLVHRDCEFAFNGWAGEHYRAHLTLAMADIPGSLFDEVLAFIEDAAPIGPLAGCAVVAIASLKAGRTGGLVVSLSQATSPRPLEYPTATGQ